MTFHTALHRGHAGLFAFRGQFVAHLAFQLLVADMELVAENRRMALRSLIALVVAANEACERQQQYRAH